MTNGTGPNFLLLEPRELILQLQNIRATSPHLVRSVLVKWMQLFRGH